MSPNTRIQINLGRSLKNFCTHEDIWKLHTRRPIKFFHALQVHHHHINSLVSPWPMTFYISFPPFACSCPLFKKLGFFLRLEWCTRLCPTISWGQYQHDEFLRSLLHLMWPKSLGLASPHPPNRFSSKYCFFQSCKGSKLCQHLEQKRFNLNVFEPLVLNPWWECLEKTWRTFD